MPLRYVTNQFATLLVERAAAEQLADEYDVEPGSATKSALASFEPQLESLTDEQKDAFREILGARAYTNDVLAQIGEISLEDQGTTDATEDDQLAEGQKLLTAWIADHDVEVNPKYAVDLDTARPGRHRPVRRGRNEGQGRAEGRARPRLHELAARPPGLSRLSRDERAQASRCWSSWR